jgi:hypothetical protein
MDNLEFKMLLASRGGRANKRLAEHLISTNMMEFADALEVLNLAFETQQMTPAQRGAFDATELIGGKS